MLSSTAATATAAPPAAETAAGAETAVDTNNHDNTTAASPSNSPCGDAPADGNVSPSSVHSHSQPSTRGELNSSQHSLRNDTSSDDPTDFSSLQGTEGDGGMHANLFMESSHIEMHPQNESLTMSSSSRQKFIKRPLNAYMIWTRQERRKILSADPKLKMNEVSKAMGERWKRMSDKEKKPYFEMARKFALEHKQALQEHPELTYAPSKKKGPKSGSNSTPIHQPDQKSALISKNHNTMVSEQRSNSASYTPDPSPGGNRSNTPRQQQILTAQGLQQSPMFVPFQTTGTMQIAQVLGVRPPGAQLMTAGSHAYGVQMSTPPATPVSGSLLVQHQQQQQSSAFIQPQQIQNQQRTLIQPAVGARSMSGNMIDLYYTSLCQPAFPTITESPVNTLAMYPPQYFLEQYNQQLNQQQQQGGGNGPNF